MSSAQAKRFASVSDEDISAILAKRTSENTDKATRQAVKTFNDFLKEITPELMANEDQEQQPTSLTQSLDNYLMPDKQTRLDELLVKFFASLRKKTSEMYKLTSLTATRNGLNR